MTDYTTRPEDYSCTATRVVVLQSLRGLADVAPQPERHIDYEGSILSTGKPFAINIRTVGGGQGRLASRIKGFDVHTLHPHRRAALRRRGDKGDLSGVVLRVTVPSVSLWLWVPWHAMGDHNGVIQWGDERLTLLGSLDGLIDFAAIFSPKDDDAGNNS